jgi:hypothetical protein
MPVGDNSQTSLDANPGMKQVSADCQILSQIGFKWRRVVRLDAI